MSSTVTFDVAGLLPPAGTSGANDLIASGTNCAVLAGYVGICINQRGSLAGGYGNYLFWIQNSTPSNFATVATDLTANKLSFGDYGVVSSSSPTCLITYFASDGLGVDRLYCAVVQGGSPITVPGSSLISNSAEGPSSLAISSSTTAYVAYTDTSTASVVLVKSTNINAATPTWSAQGTIFTATGGNRWAVVQGSLLYVAGTLYAMTYQSNSQPGPITLQKSTDDGVTWSAVGTVASSAEFGAVTPVACMKDSAVWALLYWQVSPGTSVRIAFSRNQGATWTDTQISTDSPSSLAVDMIHRSHFIAQWTFDGQGSGTTAPKFVESTDTGSTWTTITPTAPPPTTGDHVFFSAKLSAAGAASSGSNGGLASPEIALLVRSTANPPGGNLYPVYVAHGTWGLPEKNNDPDTFTSSTKAEGAALFLQAMVSPSNGEGASLHLRATVAASNGEGPAETFTATVGSDTTRYPAETGLGVLIARPRGSSFGSTWWQRTPEMPPHAVASYPATWRPEADFVGHVQRAIRDGGPLTVGELGLATALLRRRAPYVGHIQDAIRDGGPLPVGDLGLVIALVRRRAGDVGFTGSSVQDASRKRLPGDGRVREDDEEAFLLILALVGGE